MSLGDLVGGVLGFDSSAGQGAMGQSIAVQEEMWNRIKDMDLPDRQKEKILAGELSPGRIVELMESYDIPESEYADIVVDPRLADAQMSALQDMIDQGETGFTLADRLAMEEAQQASQAEAQAQQESILMRAAQRGALDSGSQLASQLMAGQDSANRVSREGTQQSAQAQDARMRAMQAAGQMAGNQRRQSFDEQAQVAGAQDPINRFNTIQRMDTQRYNLGLRQRKEDERAGLANQATLTNKQIDSGALGFQDQLSQYGVMQGTAANLANAYGNMGTSQQQAENTMASGLLQAGAAGAGIALKSDKESKKNIKNTSSEDLQSSIRDLMEKLDAYKYQYKDPQEEFRGEQTGIMAQDLEKSEMGRDMVSEDEMGTKHVDVAKSSLAALAGISDLNKRLKKLEGDR